MLSFFSASLGTPEVWMTPEEVTPWPWTNLPSKPSILIFLCEKTIPFLGVQILGYPHLGVGAYPMEKPENHLSNRYLWMGYVIVPWRVRTFPGFGLELWNDWSIGKIHAFFWAIYSDLSRRERSPLNGGLVRKVLRPVSRSKMRLSLALLSSMKWYPKVPIKRLIVSFLKMCVKVVPIHRQWRIQLDSGHRASNGQWFHVWSQSVCWNFTSTGACFRGYVPPFKC